MRKSKIYKAEHLAVKELFYSIQIQHQSEIAWQDRVMCVIHRARPEKG
jgi:hypothetical protein